MAETENLGAFFKENKKLLKDYLETRLDIYRLKTIRAFSKTAGYFIWIILSMFLLFLFVTFVGLVIGFWLSDLTGSYVKGFGLATLILLALIIIVALLRKMLFVNPIIRAIIDRANEDSEIADGEN
jgi:hypothetical protein